MSTDLFIEFVIKHTIDTFAVCRLPLPKDVPAIFKVLPEYIVEDVVDYHSFTIRYV